MAGALADVHYSHAWGVHQTMFEDMERLPWKRFVYEVNPVIGNDLQQAAVENADEISFETIPCRRFLLQKFDQFKGRASLVIVIGPLEKKNISASFNKIVSYIYENRFL